MRLEFSNVPVRRWRKTGYGTEMELAPTTAYARVMALVGRAIAADATVEMDHCIINPTPTHKSTTHDVISVRIEMPEGATLPVKVRRRSRERRP